jgi:hypothetical protein
VRHEPRGRGEHHRADLGADVRRRDARGSAPRDPARSGM